MKITHINRIREHRIFADFSWPNDLPQFGRYNLIYGWNGSGKTTLSKLLRCIEKKEDILEGDTEFRTDSASHDGRSLSSDGNLPPIRVFNQDFVAANFLRSDSTITPIFFLGEDSVEKQKRAEELHKIRLGEQEKITNKKTEKSRAAKALDDFCVAQGRAIKAMLSSSGVNPYNNYDKASFKATCVKLGKLSSPPPILSDQEKDALKQQKDGTPKEKIGGITIEYFNIGQLHEKVEILLRRTVISQTISDLLNDSILAEWAQSGLLLHTGEKHSDSCRFCGSAIPLGRIAQLEAHFNDEYSQFLSALDSEISNLAELRRRLTAIKLPDKAKFYEHLVGDYSRHVQVFERAISTADTYLGFLVSALTNKRSKLFVSVDVKEFTGNFEVPADDRENLAKECNDIVTRHNVETDNFSDVVSKARKQLEEALVAEILNEFKGHLSTVETINTEITLLETAVSRLGEEITVLERDIVEHRRPAEEITAELENYLGRDELKFELSGNGYQLVRHGVLASNLSEGEKTAIAFLYFLKALQDKGFDLANGIVVIDDPVSSLDANSLFCAFGYMKARTKDAGQLFVLTHNFNFFRQVRNWLHKGLRGPVRKEARFYFMESSSLNGKRNASLGKLDHLLREYESEYHYIFKQVYDEAERTVGAQPMEHYYHLPNLGRRLLESFFAFRFPSEGGDLYKSLEKAQGEPATKARLLRFLDSYSHSQTMGDGESDLSILSETPQIMKDILEVIEAEDRKHFEEMVGLVSSPEEGT